MTTLNEAAQMALEALEHIQRCIGFATATIHQGSATWCQSEDAIEALRTALAQQGEPQGWKLVPVDPTTEMKFAGQEYISATANRAKGLWWYGNLYEAMLAAAPAPQAQPAQGEVTRRKIFVCAHCDGIYADQTVTQCDCMEGTGADFVEGFAEYPALQPAPQPAQGVPFVPWSKESEMRESFVRNCEVTLKEGDGPLFVGTQQGVFARLDGYSIKPLQSAQPVAAPEHNFDDFETWCKELVEALGKAIYFVDEELRMRKTTDLEALFVKKIPQPAAPYDPIGAWNKGFEEGKRLAQPVAQPLKASEIVTMYAEQPTCDADMIEFAREIEQAHGIKKGTV